MSEECLAGCCPHDNTSAAGCPRDLPQAPLPERAAHLYACQMLSTYKISAITGADRHRLAWLLREAGVEVVPNGRRVTRRTAEDDRLDQLITRMYLEQRLPSTQIATLTGVPDHIVRDRLRASGVPIRTRGQNNREDREAISADEFAELYLRTGLSADEVGKVLGVSRRIVLRSAHDQGLPVRVGGAPPLRGPSEIELLTALYADPQVRHVLGRHGVPVVMQAGPIWKRFPVPHPLTAGLAADLYEGCGLSLQHIELLTGRPAAAAGALLRASGIQLRPAGGSGSAEQRVLRRHFRPICKTGDVG